MSGFQILLKILFDHLSRARRIQLSIVLFTSILSGFSELLSLGAILPLLVAFSNPEALWSSPIIKHFALILNWKVPTDIVIPLALFFVIVAVLSSIVRQGHLYAASLISAKIGSDLSCKAFNQTLAQSYTDHLQQNSSVIISNITTHVSRSLVAISSALYLLTALISSLFVVIWLCTIDLQVAIFAFFGLALSYIGIAIFIRNTLNKNSTAIREYTSSQVKVIQESLGSIKEILLSNTQSVFYNRYRSVDLPQRRLQMVNIFLGSFPRYIIELIALSSFSLMGAYLSKQSNTNFDVVTVLGAFALGFQKLLPSLQSIYASWASIKGLESDLFAVFEMLDLKVEEQEPIKEGIQFNELIHLQNVSYSYPNTNFKALKAVDLLLRKGEVIGIIGETGSGKSTLLMMLMGLISPAEGHFYVDSNNIYSSDSSFSHLQWRSLISLVPQNVFLSDTTIAENIAFQQDLSTADMKNIEYAASLACIDSFIASLPLGYNTVVGERGTRLSGGQIQRIGIARALYRSSQILILDEATSALDIMTEERVMTSIRSLSPSKTLIVVAHRLSTLSFCDRIFEIKNHKVVEVKPP